MPAPGLHRALECRRADVGLPLPRVTLSSRGQRDLGAGDTRARVRRARARSAAGATSRAALKRPSRDWGTGARSDRGLFLRRDVLGARAFEDFLRALAFGAILGVHAD